MKWGRGSLSIPLFIEDFDWKDEFDFWKLFGEDFDWEEEFDFRKLFGEDFSGWE